MLYKCDGKFIKEKKIYLILRLTSGLLVLDKKMKLAKILSAAHCKVLDNRSQYVRCFCM